MTCDEVLNELSAVADPARIAGMARFGISTKSTIGVSVPLIRGVARLAGKDHQLAEQLWQSGVHEARILACLVDRPIWVDEVQMEKWVRDFDSWDLCDQACFNLFAKTPFAFSKAEEWADREEEFVRRAGFALMAALALASSKASDEELAAFFPIMVRHAGDDRNFVKKAVNWALRQIGKRNEALRSQAVATAREMLALPYSSAHWIARDALRELTRHGTVLQ
jgi:3-methyladenine DNA glycosylase AlkD